MPDRKRRWLVTGIHPVLGHAPGVTFTADIPDEQARALQAGGALKPAPAAEKPKADDDGKESPKP